MSFPKMSRTLWMGLILILVVIAVGAWRLRLDAGTNSSSAPGEKQTAAKVYDTHIRPILAKHCFACHGANKPKGDFRLDQLSPDFANKAGFQKWQLVLKRIQSGEMPPKSKPRPPQKDVLALTNWISGEVKAAAAMHKAQGRVVLRRLNRLEYQNTVCNLLGIDIDLQDMLPEDSSAGGFDNVGEALHVSSFLMERYLEAADKALDVAIANGPQPKLIKKRYDLKDERHVKVTKEKVFLKPDDALILFSSSAWQAVMLGQFYPPDRGSYRFRISSSAYQSKGKPVTYEVKAGRMGMAGKTHLVSYFDAPAGKPKVEEFVESLDSRNTIRIIPYGLASAQSVNKIGAADYKGPGLAIQWVEVEGPLHDSWPPESHRRIFGDLPQGPAPAFKDRNRVEVVSKNPEADAKKILLKFARRAFRRSVNEKDIQPYITLVKSKLAKDYSFERAVRVGLMAVMVSPEFLFLRERPGKLDDFALASRLSYFLWSTMPDEELLMLAENGKLHNPKTLREQVERMLKHPKAASLTKNFVSQWLNLREIDATSPSHILYPEYDEMLKYAMLRETYLFFDEVLQNDLSLLNFVSSDFTILNGRLAKHYGIPGPDGWEFQKTKLPPDSHRGGLLTMASTLKVTANGTYTSPVLRGTWVLDRILGKAPPPPPEGVSAIEPDIRGATTIREQLAKHRSNPSCASCHAKIDPPGFALESFDVIGGWRDFYRTSGNGKAVIKDGEKMRYRHGKKVDPSDELPDGARFENIDEFKKLLLRDKDQIARALTVRLMTYATGALPQPGDDVVIEAIVGKLRDRDYGLRTLVHEIVQSKLFQEK